MRLTIPARPGYAQVARLATTALAARLAFSYDEVEDVRMAVGELCTLLLAEERTDHRIEVTCRASDDLLDIRAVLEPPADPAPLTPLSAQILAAVADDVQPLTDRAGFRVRKRRRG